MFRYVRAVLLSVSLMAPVVTVYAQDRGHETHQWNDNENQYWHQYLKEHHKKDHDWGKASKSEQRAYWKWRESHSDRH
jgi:hypothetical protein